MVQAAMPTICLRPAPTVWVQPNPFRPLWNKAGLKAEDIGWINLHGTGTQHNDSMESRAVAEVFGSHTLARQPNRLPVIPWVQPVRLKPHLPG